MVYPQPLSVVCPVVTTFWHAHGCMQLKLVSCLNLKVDMAFRLKPVGPPLSKVGKKWTPTTRTKAWVKNIAYLIYFMKWDSICQFHPKYICTYTIYHICQLRLCFNPWDRTMVNSLYNIWYHISSNLLAFLSQGSSMSAKI